MIKPISELINNIESINFESESSTGYLQLKCPVCNDYKIRAGFKITNTEIIYNCFRGKCTASIIQPLNQPLTRKFKYVLGKCGVTIPNELLFNKNTIAKIDKKLYRKFEYKDNDIPKKFKTYNENKHTAIRDYLEERCVTNKEFLVYKLGGNNYELVVPFFLFDKLIGWQKHNIRSGDYVKSSNSHMIYCPSGKIRKNVIVVEGVFDALMFPNAVAVLRDKISAEQAYVLRNYSPILLPDRNNSKFINIAKEYGWRICIPLAKDNNTKSWTEKDANEYVKTNGKFALAKIVGENIYTDYKKAEIMYEQWKKR